ncbi:hypothetical protein ACSDR0_37885 [Streptosporangium sp. G11]|uniref:hypothetical protein n=1 Tax=Streptosporangium sp. G11 TaxID=3436926 RepID=UPI003EBE469A
MSRTRVAVLFGGQNTEHEVSLSSATGVVRHLDRDKYELTPIRITTDGRWIIGRDTRVDPTELMTPEPAVPMTALPNLAAAVDVMRAADVAFPMLHGPYGEDGTVQSVLARAGVPYVGSCAAGMRT